MRATKLAFEKRYSDDSGVESAVRLEGSVIEFERHGHGIEFDATDLAWLMDALVRVKAELETEADA